VTVWNWVIFHGDSPLGSLDATTAEILAASTGIAMVIDWDRMRIELV
jgi:hypothetical protein